MIKGIFSSLSGMLAAKKKLQNCANNLVSLEKNKDTAGDNTKIKHDLNSSASSKINISKEMVNQITAKTAFHANARVTVVADKNIGTILDIKS